MWRKKYNDYFNTDDKEPSPEKAGDTREFAVDSAAREPAERCEERGSVKDYSFAYVLWRVLKPAAIFILSASLIIFLSVSAFNYVKNNYFDPVNSTSSEVKTIQIKAGSSLSKIAGTLYDNRIIRNKFVFQVYVDFNDLGSKLQAGTYNLSSSMTIDDIISILAAGNGNRQVFKVTLTEGMTVEDMAQTLVAKGVFNTDEKKQFLDMCKDPGSYSKDYSFVKGVVDSTDKTQRKYILEGYLFPDTYEFYADATPDDVMTKLLDRFNQIFADYKDKAETEGMTIDQVMALASIIEWEALPQDFDKVSAVFHNRLKSGMKLGSEATVRYVLGKKPPYTSSELKTDSPYNTLVIPALPIGPICNPGKTAIDAALNPDQDYVNQNYLYFCNKDLEGNLIFAKTPKEQNKNVAAYNKLLKNAPASASPSPTS